MNAGYWALAVSCATSVKRVTTWRTIFKERLFSVSKESVRSWSHAFLIAYHKMFTKKLLPFHPGKVMRRKKRKKNYKGNCKAFCIKRKCKNITFSVQNYIIQWNHLMKNCICVKHVISILIKMKSHVRQSAVNGFRAYYQMSGKIWKNLKRSKFLREFCLIRKKQ